jgi:hypothetical protein
VLAHELIKVWLTKDFKEDRGMTSPDRVV